MQIVYSPSFVRAYKALSLDIRKKVEIVEDWFKKNPFDARLKTHKLSGRLSGFWALSVTGYYRIVFKFAKKDIVHFDLIGGHDIYK